MDETGGRSLPRRGALLLLALSAGLLLLRLGDVPLVGPDEPRYARVAVEMHRSGDRVTPTLQGQPWLEKPALYYWLAGLAFSVFGETEAAARLPSVAAALLLVGTTALVGARLFGAASGLHAGFVLATSILVFAYGRAAAMDMLVAAFVTLALGLLALALLDVAGRAALPAAYAAMGLATLAKGPIGFLLPGLVVAGYVAVTREWGLVRRLAAPVGIVLFLAVAGPWYAAVYAAQGQEFVDVFLLDHNLQRFTSTLHRHAGWVGYYVPVLVGLLFPWSGLILPGLALGRPRHSRPDLFVLLWLLLPFAFFSVAGSKLPGYILPCLPPLAILMGRAATLLAERRGHELPVWARPRVVALVGLVLGSLIATAPAWLRFRLHDPGWATTVPLAAWSLIVAFAAARALDRRPAAALGLLRVGGAGFLVLIALAAPPILARQESGRGFFAPAGGREVLAWGAWRTAWMAGYFYNDGRVREVRDATEVDRALEAGPVLVLCGPAERRRLEALPAYRTLTLAYGAKGNALLRVERR